jgi:lysophospholipase L1-like esterase
MRQQVIEAIKEVCAKYDVPVFDASRDSNIESDSFDFRKKYFQGGKGTDTAHLNAKGHDLFLPVAEQFLLQHIK